MMTNAAQIDLETTAGPGAEPDFVPAADDAEAVPAVEQSAGPPVAAAAQSRWPVIAAGLALLAAVTGTTSVVMAGRVSAHAAEILARAERDEAAFDRLPGLIARFEAGIARAEAVPASPAATPADLRAEMAGLRRDLARYAAANGVAGIRDAQSELANRLGQVIEKLNRFEAKPVQGVQH